MCPLAIVAGVSGAASIGGQIARHEATNARADAIERSARVAHEAQIEGLLDQRGQIQTDVAQRIFLAERQARAARSLAKVGAGEAGVAGLSAEAILDDIRRDAIEYRIGTQRQKRRELRRTDRAMEAADVELFQRIDSAPRSSALGLGLGILSTGIDWAQFEVSRQPPGDPDTKEEGTDG